MKSNSNLSISERLFATAKENRGNTAVTFMGKKISYKKLLQKVQKTALAFYHLGIKSNQKVLVALPNIPQAVYVLYALNRLGAAAVFVSPLSAEKELEFYIKKCGAAAIVTLAVTYEKHKDVFNNSANTPVIITDCLDEVSPIPKVSRKKGAVLWREFISGTLEENIYLSPQASDDTAVVLFSGGTTGVPKGVELTNLNLNRLAEKTALICDSFINGASMLAALPVFHGFGLGICIHTVLLFGGNVLLISHFKPEKAARLILRRKPEYLACVPAMLEPLMNTRSLKNARLGFISGIFSGGDSLPFELEEKFNEFTAARKCKVKIRSGYGLTECVAASCLMPSNEVRPLSVGKPYPGTLYKTVKPGTDITADNGKTGEICICSDTVMKGYLNDPEETHRVLKYHDDGRLWLHTGDLGYIDGDGFVYFKQRLKRMIVTNGINIYPCELEKVLLKHPDVKECCVLGIKDKSKGQVPVAFVVLKENCTSNENMKLQIIKYLQRYFSGRSMPRYVFLTDSIAKNSLGKIIYPKLTELAQKMIDKK